MSGGLSAVSQSSWESEYAVDHGEYGGLPPVRQKLTHTPASLEMAKTRSVHHRGAEPIIHAGDPGGRRRINNAP